MGVSGRLYPQGKTPPPVSLNRRLDVTYSWSGHFGEETNFLPALEIQSWFLGPTALSLAQALNYSACITIRWGIHGGALGWGTALQAGRLRFWFPNGVIGIFHWVNPCDCTMFLGSTRLPTKMSTRDMFHGGKGSRCTGLTNWLPPCADCLEILGAWMSWHPKAYPDKGSWCTGLTNWLPPCADCLEILGACVSWHPKVCPGLYRDGF